MVARVELVLEHCIAGLVLWEDAVHDVLEPLVRAVVVPQAAIQSVRFKFIAAIHTDPHTQLTHMSVAIGRALSAMAHLGHAGAFGSHWTRK